MAQDQESGDDDAYLGRCEKCKRSCWDSERVYYSPRDQCVHHGCWWKLKELGVLEQHPDIQRIYLEDQLLKLQEGVNTRLFRRTPMPGHQRAKVKELNDRMFMLIDDLNKIVP